ncbi:MAG TPA: carbohydrate ABC transporter permease [Clostridiales bacterium]|nr:carbohydrate ABC transporter permease [Clostridiales bacterium]
MNRKLKTDYIFDTINYLFMFILILVTLYPLLHVFLGSISDPYRLQKHRGILLYPLGFDLESYARVFANKSIVTGFRNSVFITITGVLLSMIMTILAAFFLSRRDILLKKHVMWFIVLTMYFSGGLIPSYMNIKELGLYNSIWVLIIPGALSTWNVILMRTYFLGLPNELEEAATIDGASEYYTLTRIIIPLSKPIIAVLVLYYGVDKWNEWFAASIYLRDRKMYPIQLILREILINNDPEKMMEDVMLTDKSAYRETIKYATTMAVTLPILFVYPFLQKYFVKGVLLGSLKG